MSAAPDDGTFSDLGLSKEVMTGIEAVGYETPSPIQARIIPLVLAGRDVLTEALLPGFQMGMHELFAGDPANEAGRFDF